MRSTLPNTDQPRIPHSEYHYNRSCPHYDVMVSLYLGGTGVEYQVTRFEMCMSTTQVDEHSLRVMFQLSVRDTNFRQKTARRLAGDSEDMM